MSDFLSSLRRLPHSRIARNIIMLGGSTAMAQLIGLLALPFVTRLYAPAELGAAALFLAFASFWANALSLRYDQALLIAGDDAESHILHRLALILVVLMSLAAMPALWLLQRFALLEFQLLPAWVPLFVFPVLLGQGLFMVYRAWALRAGLVRHITQAVVGRAAANAATKLALGLHPGGIIGLLAAEVAGAYMSMMKLMLATRRHFAVSRPPVIRAAQLGIVGRKYAKFPLLETPSAWIDALAMLLPLPLVASLYGMEAAGWFGLARLVVSVPNSQIGAAVGDVFQMELAQAVVQRDQARAQSLFYTLLKKMAILGLLPLVAMVTLHPWGFALVFGPQWAPAGLIAACLAPWMYAALVISPLSRALSVLQAQQWKLVYDIAAVSLLLLSYALACMLDTSLTGFSLLISLANILGYGVYAVLLARLIDGKLQGGAHPKEE